MAVATADGVEASPYMPATAASPCLATDPATIAEHAC